MGDILNSREITEALGPDLTLHFLALYADPRGCNLRNNVAHGLIKPDDGRPSSNTGALICRSAYRPPGRMVGMLALAAALRKPISHYQPRH
jgi:hypothetical protein